MREEGGGGHMDVPSSSVLKVCSKTKSRSLNPNKGMWCRW